jgi:hypothetical protein
MPNPSGGRLESDVHHGYICFDNGDFNIHIEIEIEIVYNMYRMRRFFTKSRMRRLLSLGPPNYAIQGTYKSGLDR